MIASRARLADSRVARAVGLLGSKGLDSNKALVIQPCWSIHTLFMRFKIDVVFLDKAGTVRKVVHGLPTYRFAASRGANVTIEMSAGTMEGRDLVLGDILEIRPAAA